MSDKSYEIKCPYCNAELKTRKSIFHNMGFYEFGRGTCLKCSKVMQVQYLPNEDKMKTITWEEWEKELKKRRIINEQSNK